MAAADYYSQAILDPGYLGQHGLDAKSIIQLILGSGNAANLSPELAQQYGITPDQVSAANQNPYGTKQSLEHTLSGNQYGITNNAQAHGALYSGAHAAAQLHELQNAGQRNYDATTDLASRIAGIGQQDTNALTGAYTGIANAALNTPTPPPAVPGVAPPPAGAPALNGLGTPYVDPGARESFTQPVPIKPPKLPNIGGANRSFR